MKLKRTRSPIEMMGQLPDGIDELEIVEVELDRRNRDKLTTLIKTKDGKTKARLFIPPALPLHDRRNVIERLLVQMNQRPIFEGSAREQLAAFLKAFSGEKPNPAELKVTGIITPQEKRAEGLLIKSVFEVWLAVVKVLEVDWTRAYEIPARVWEEIVAGAFDRGGFEVVLTPRSGDDGRDVIAVRKGYGGVKILGSVKAYKPGHLVPHEHVREVLGVLTTEPDASKAMITTTSDFAPKVRTSPRFLPFMPNRLELLNGDELRAWLVELAKK